MKKKILYFTLGILGLIFIAFLALKNGISIPSVQFDFLKLEQLYIKMDKKLILRAKNIVVNENNASTNSNETSQTIVSKELIKIAENLKYLYALVEEINIENLTFGEHKAQIYFNGNEFFIDGDLFFLKLSLKHENDELKAQIQKLFLKEYGVDMVGDLSINTKSEFYHLKAGANSSFLDFNTTLSYKEGQLSYKVEDVNIKNIDIITKHTRAKVKLPEELDLWIFKRAKAEFYHLDFLEGFADFARGEYYLDEIKAQGFAKNVSVRLDEKITPIKIPSLKINFSKQKLDLNFAKANYNGANLNGSKVYLYDLLNSKKAGIYLLIKTGGMIFDEKLANALKNYEFSLPFYQKSGKTSGFVELKIGFHKDAKVFYKGNLTLANATLSLADFNLNSALVQFDNGKLNIDANGVSNSFLNANLKANIDLEQKNGVFDTQLTRLYYEDYFDMRNQSVKLLLDFKEAVKLDIPAWNAHLNFSEGLEANLENLKTFMPYFSAAKSVGLSDIKHLRYKSANFVDFNLSIDNASFEKRFLINGKSPYTQDSFEIRSLGGNLTLDSKSNLISASFTPNIKEIHLKNLTFLYEKGESEKSFALETNPHNIKIGGANVGVILLDMNKTLHFERLEASLNKAVLNANASSGKAQITFHKSPQRLNLVVNNMDDEFLNLFLQKEAFREGVFNAKVEGSGDEFFEGEFEVKNTYVKDLKGINQLVSFVDTVPSLVMFRAPTFNQKGLHIQNGKVLFNRKKDLLSFDAINLEGDSVDLFGLGSANLRLNTLDLNLELKTLKSASDAISKVPILNYVVLGDKQVISTNIKVNGSIDNPKFNTQILTDTLKTPFNLIKNVIKLPMNLFN
ncbi:DUF3971 domain-containing protein [Campylobacter helveticus]|uniref:YhdP family protein n=1 Tax=Campylobacter helveticus TaxID=28898 RepID=UPI0011124392|nr:AsmA-like C-terminal domain-containing protein [Campylobacter helveticus]TNB54426.1 DUF3971 domain-containing protein [Campylobacter helveticus]